MTDASLLPEPRDPYLPALALRFSVKIGQLVIEHVVACEGLTAEFEVEEYREGGNAGHVHRLPLRVKYGNVKLTRPVDRDSAALAAWFAGTVTALERCDAVVVARSDDGAEVARWELTGAWPVRYTGPQLSVNGTTTATEVLELAHNGFTVSAP